MLATEIQNQIKTDPNLKAVIRNIYDGFLASGQTNSEAQQSTETIILNNRVIIQDFLQNRHHCNPDKEPECKQSQNGFETIINYENGRFYLGLKHCLHWEKAHQFEKMRQHFWYCDYDLEMFHDTASDYWNLLESSADLFTNQEIDERKIFLQKAFQQIRDHSHKGIYLYGESGVGKTVLLRVIANTVAAQGNQSIAFVNLANFVDRQKASLGQKDIQHHREIMRRLKQVEILIIDDLGAENVSSWSRDDLLLSLLSARMDQEKLTFFGSIFSMQQLKDNYALQKNQAPIEKVKQKRFLERIRVLASEYYLHGESHRA